MKPLHICFSGLSLATLLFCAQTRAGESSAGQFDFGTFTPPPHSREFVEVNINRNLIAMATRLAESSEPELTEVLRDLEHIRVTVIGIDEDSRAAMEERIESVHRQLAEENWDRVVLVQNPGEAVGVFAKTRGEEAVAGLVVTVLEGNRHVIFAHVLGDIKPEELSVLGERFDVEPLKELRRHTRR